MRVAIVCDEPGSSDAPDQLDVLYQVETVEKALAALGHHALRMRCGLNLDDIRNHIERSGADLVVNLVESIEGKGRLIHLFPSLLDAMSLPYTGAGAEAMMLTSNKVLAKRWMAAAGIPTPPWIAGSCDHKRPASLPEAMIIKSVWEHASIGMDENSIVNGAGEPDIRAILKARGGSLGGEAFAETFVDGREFNLSLLAGENGPEVLSPAEIVFDRFSEGMPKIVDYRAKWDETAYAYHHTPRRFDFSSEERPLLESLKRLALACWRCFDLSGYARVDFRVDAHGNPWVLEVNANPCLSPDAGFAAALERSGISFETAMARIIRDV